MVTVCLKMDEPNCSTAPDPEPPNEINGQSNDDGEEVPMEIVKDDETSPARLVINGYDDENEESLMMSIEDAQNYILTKVEVFIRDPKINPLLVLKNQLATLHEKIKIKSEEFMKLNRLFDALYRDQVKFLRHIGVMPRLETQTVGVSVDLPWLPDSMPGSLREDLLNTKSERVFMQPGTSGANAANSARSAKRDGPIECIDLTDDGDTPDPPASTPASSASSTPTPASSTQAPTPASSTPTLMPASGTATPTPVSGASTPTPANGAAAPTTSSGPTPTPMSSIPAVTPASGASTPVSVATSTADSNENKNVIISSSPASSNVVTQNNTSGSGIRQNPSQHPVPLPAIPPNQGNESEIPPKPRLKISVDKNGIVLQWDMPPECKNMKIIGFEIVGYQEKSNVPASSSLWKKIGCVNPMPLPMSCTLTQFVEGYKYHFSIRALSKEEKIGHFSDPASIMFVPETKKN